MNKKEALVLLSFHSGRNSDIHNPKWINGFLGALRKFDGSLLDKNFEEVMECLKIVAEEFKNEKIDRDLLADVYGVYYQTSLWISQRGILRDLPLEVRKKLEVYMYIYSDIVSLLLECNDESLEEIFGEYDDYLQGYTNYD
ncbi:hypothetical protein [Clostridium saccharoperbutylacetonicum]|uniref:hypothetical protein n=1 Tax=Clostridium saccharoperbutylacetonicum TaxID=36745 RepID=UPI0039ED3E1A